jgi:hypothetical protein
MKGQVQTVLMSIRLGFLPASVQSRGGLGDGNSTPLNDPHAVYEDALGEAFRSAPCSHFTANRRMGSARLTSWDDHPGCVEPDVVDPKIQEFRPAVDETSAPLIYVAGRVVQGHTVQVSHAHDDLQDIPEASAAGDGHRRREA